MSSANSTILKWSKSHPSFKKVFLYYNLYIRNLNAYSKSYINHLIGSHEILASMILTTNNIVFYQDLMKKIREAIKNNAFDVFYEKYINVI